MDDQTSSISSAPTTTSSTSTSPRALTWLTRPLRSHHALPSDPTILWEHATTALDLRDLRTATRALRRLARPRHAAHPRAHQLHLQAATVLAMLALAADWDGHAALPSAAARRLRAAAAAGSFDAAAFTLLHDFRARHLPPAVELRGLVAQIRRAAHAAHPLAQAVLGAMLSRCPPFDDGHNADGEAALADGSAGEAALSWEKRHERAGKSVPVGRDVTAGAAWLRKSAAAGCFLALDYLEAAVMNERHGRAHTLGLQGRSSSDRERISAKEYFECVRQAAVAEVPECAVRLAKLRQSGVGCEVDEEEARAWILVAAGLNVPSAVSAAHAQALQENMAMAQLLGAKEVGKEQRAEARRKMRENNELIKGCEERMKNWREVGKEVLLVHRWGGLTGTVSSSLCEGVLSFIAEREMRTWGATMEEGIR